MKTPKERAAELVAQGFEQVSRKYRTVARLPPGKTALEALREVDPRFAADCEQRIEQMAADQYRRVYAKGDDTIDLDPETFHEYLIATGRNPGPLFEYDESGNKIGLYSKTNAGRAVETEMDAGGAQVPQVPLG